MSHVSNSHADDVTAPAQAATIALAGAQSKVGLKATCAVVFALGAGLIYLVGFAHSSVLHNAAHDTRHGLAFPCH